MGHLLSNIFPSTKRKFVFLDVLSLTFLVVDVMIFRSILCFSSSYSSSKLKMGCSVIFTVVGIRSTVESLNHE